jgi:acyl-[acyl-carrier-protein] desaturase
MQIDYRTPPEEPMRRRLDRIKEVLKAIDPQVRALIAEHRERSTRWMPHEVLPWGRGEDFNDKPWAPQQSPLRPEIALALETNLLTEDNLPYYHAQIAKVVDEGSALHEWNGLWTAEESAHAIVMRDYVHLSRALDPARLEVNRLAVMQKGFGRRFADPFEVLAYTAAQELATRISHLSVGQKSGDPALLKVLSLVARDENFHYIFYRAVVKAILDVAPELMLPSIMRQLYTFNMPGEGFDRFAERSAAIAAEGIFGTREYRDEVVKPILFHWGIDKLRGLPPEAERARERILKLEKVLDRMLKQQGQPRLAALAR